MYFYSFFKKNIFLFYFIILLFYLLTFRITDTVNLRRFSSDGTGNVTEEQEPITYMCTDIYCVRAACKTVFQGIRAIELTQPCYVRHSLEVQRPSLQGS